MAPNINNPGGVKNDPAEIRDGVVSDATRFPGGFIDQRITEAGAGIAVGSKFQVPTSTFLRSFSVRSQAGDPKGVTFDPDGTQMYVVGGTSNRIFQYSLTTSFDVSTASFVRSFDVSAQDGGPKKVVFKPDGTKMYLAGSNNDSVFQYSLSTGFDISTASFSQSFSVGGQIESTQSLSLESDGTRLYAIGSTNEDVAQYNLSTGFDVSTASFSKSLDVSPQDPDPTGGTLSPDGSKLYIIATGNDRVFQYSLSTGFDISTASFSKSLDIKPQSTEPSSLTFRPDGTQLYVLGNTENRVFQYAVGTLVGEL